MPSILIRLLAVFFFFVTLGACSAEESSTVQAAHLKTVTLDVQNMTCPMCKITLRKALEKVDGVQEAAIDYGAKTARVAFDPETTPIEALTQATTDAGYPSILKVE